MSLSFWGKTNIPYINLIACQIIWTVLIQISNKYEPESENYLIKDDFINRFTISEYIHYDSEISNLRIKELADVKSYQKVAYMFL